MVAPDTSVKLCSAALNEAGRAEHGMEYHVMSCHSEGRQGRARCSEGSRVVSDGSGGGGGGGDLRPVGLGFVTHLLSASPSLSFSMGSF